MKLFRYILRSAFLILLFSIVGKSYAQTYNNEWIDYSKTYYKFKILNDGMYKITADVLSNLGLSSTPANQFQLWHNGKVVALYVQNDGSSPITGTNFIKFYGNRNDGTLDTALYKNKASQMSNYFSLETDSSAYFLTVNTDTSENLHFQTSTNTIPTGATPVPYFMTTWGSYQRSQINAGRASSYGLYVYSSTYDDGEGWSSYNIGSNGTGSSFDLPDVGSLNWYTAGPTPELAVTLAGASILGTNRTVNLLINGTTINSQVVNGFNIGKLVTPITNLNTFTSYPKIIVQPNNSPSSTDDRIVVGKIELTYPSQFYFAGSNLAKFQLPASSTNQYIQTTRFNVTSSNPELFDITNGKRYIGAMIGNADTWGFYLDDSNTDRNLVIENVSAGLETPITNINARTFTNPSTTQGNYLIISSSLLRTGSDPVAQYQQYRNSSVGGSFNAQIYDITQLEDQFAWGIRMHPLAIKNFLKFARNKFSSKPEYCLLIGHGLTYDQYYNNQNNTGINQLATIPTFGYPASDVLLASDNYLPAAATPIGRISAISTDEVSNYLSKVKEYEAAQQNQNQTIDNKAWMKNVVQIAGGSDANESNQFLGYLNSYASILTDTLMGGTAYNFNKYTNQTSSVINEALLRNLFTGGFSLMNYWGHASSTSLDYNLDQASNYDNAGKYPIFYVNGCDVIAGSFSYDASRLSTLSTIPEDFLLTSNAGAIAFIAQSYLGVTDFLQNYSLPFYKSLGISNYGKPVSLSQIDAAQQTTINTSYYPYSDTLTTNAQAEQNMLMGDPFVSLNSFTKPDFAIEDASVTVTPSYIDLSQSKFHFKAYLYNLGKATGDSLLVKITRTHPNGNVDILYNQNIASIRYIDSIELDVPVSGSIDQGQNSLSFSIDPNNQYDELSKLNNTLNKSVYIYGVGLTPIYPYEYSIVNRQNIKLIASTANPIASSTQYAMEIDTTTLFNSSLKVRKTLTSIGGALEFDPGLSFSDSTVYYWRVSPIPSDGDYHWNVSSFLYLAKATQAGFNQSHLYQQLNSEGERISLDSTSRTWNFNGFSNLLNVTHGVVQRSVEYQAQMAVKLNGSMFSEYNCGNTFEVVFNVLDGNTLLPYYNSAVPNFNTNTSGTYFQGSIPANCSTYDNLTGTNFEFDVSTIAGRNAAQAFMDWIPNNAFVVTRLFYFPPYQTYDLAPVWKNDITTNGNGKSLYSSLFNAGFTQIDNFNSPKIWIYVYQKNSPSFKTSTVFSNSLDDAISLDRTIDVTDSLGYITSPNFGPAKKWHTMLWDGYSQETTPGDKATVDLIGVNSAGQETTLRTVDQSQKSVDISDIDAATYPYIKFYMRNADSINFTPYQLKYWRLLYDAVPEGALAANVYYKSTSDSVTKGADYSMDIAFKNIGDVPFEDSLKVNYTLTDKSNVAHLFSLSKLKPLASGDTTLIHISVPGTDTTSRNLSTNIYTGSNTQYLDVNPDNNPIEQTHANNFLSQPLYVSGDDGDVSLDITFDGVHILNNDIVASTPKIIAKLTSDSKYQLLSDTALLTLQLKYPDGTLKRIKYGTDTLLFTGAKDSSDNAALANFAPYLTQDGTYELIVQGKSTTASTSVSQYSISFQVYNKPMISDMFNYPNPFTTSTAFVFTLTGSVVPQNLRIEILTITGKIVKEITKAELGPLKIGRNITEYKWDGTDQYGQKLANGVYIYRVITNLDGKKLDKFNVTDTNGNSVNTGQYFNKGYGKMYLMR